MATSVPPTAVRLQHTESLRACRLTDADLRALADLFDHPFRAERSRLAAKRQQQSTFGKQCDLADMRADVEHHRLQLFPSYSVGTPWHETYTCENWDQLLTSVLPCDVISITMSACLPDGSYVRLTINLKSGGWPAASCLSVAGPAGPMRDMRNRVRDILDRRRSPIAGALRRWWTCLPIAVLYAVGLYALMDKTFHAVNYVHTTSWWIYLGALLASLIVLAGLWNTLVPVVSVDGWGRGERLRRVTYAVLSAVSIPLAANVIWSVLGAIGIIPNGH